MKSKKLEINTNSRKFYRQYVALLNPMFTLRSKVLDVLAELLYFNNKLKDIPAEHRWKIIMDHDTKNEIKNNLGISAGSLDNTLSELRKKGILIDNQISENHLVLGQVFPNGGFDLRYVFKITNNE